MILLNFWMNWTWCRWVGWTLISLPRLIIMNLKLYQAFYCVCVCTWERQWRQGGRPRSSWRGSRQCGPAGRTVPGLTAWTGALHRTWRTPVSSSGKTVLIPIMKSLFQSIILGYNKNVISKIRSALKVLIFPRAPCVVPAIMCWNLVFAWRRLRTRKPPRRVLRVFQRTGLKIRFSRMQLFTSTCVTSVSRISHFSLQFKSQFRHSKQRESSEMGNCDEDNLSWQYDLKTFL